MNIITKPHYSNKNILTICHSWSQRVLQAKLILIKRIHEILQHPQPIAFPPVSFPHKYGVHHREEVALPQIVITNSPCMWHNKET